MRRNFWLDVILLISGAICIGTGLSLDFYLLPAGDFEIRYQMRQIHIYSGYVLSAGIILHVAWHAGWFKAAARQFFSKD